jgi:hypothetical protein
VGAMGTLGGMYETGALPPPPRPRPGLVAPCFFLCDVRLWLATLPADGMPRCAQLTKNAPAQLTTTVAPAPQVSTALPALRT